MRLISLLFFVILSACVADTTPPLSEPETVECQYLGIACHDLPPDSPIGCAPFPTVRRDDCVAWLRQCYPSLGDVPIVGCEYTYPGTTNRIGVPVCLDYDTGELLHGNQVQDIAPYTDELGYLQCLNVFEGSEHEGELSPWLCQLPGNPPCEE